MAQCGGVRAIVEFYVIGQVGAAVARQTALYTLRPVGEANTRRNEARAGGVHRNECQVNGNYSADRRSAPAGEVDKSDTFKDAAMLKRLHELQALADKDREHILYALDGLLRDAKARKAYA
ncbi:MAG: hypothetical protein JNJ91_12945 [Flavobacteriales bacterium]|nr:hypothetical protein [Flavobacteriales bacterium]